MFLWDCTRVLNHNAHLMQNVMAIILLNILISVVISPSSLQLTVTVTVLGVLKIIDNSRLCAFLDLMERYLHRGGVCVMHKN